MAGREPTTLAGREPTTLAGREAASGEPRFVVEPAPYATGVLREVPRYAG